MTLDRPEMPLAPYTTDEALRENIPAEMIQAFKADVSLAQALTADVEPGMSKHQIDNFVMGDLPDRVTPYGLVQQALREIAGRYESILSLQKEWETMQAQVKLLTAQIEMLQQVESPLSLAKAELRQAKLNDLLRRMPMVSIKAKDLFRQLQAFLRQYEAAKAQVPGDISTEELDKREWDAKYLVRCWKGRLNYLPGHSDPEYHADMLELAMFMRVHNFTRDEVRKIASESDKEQRWTLAEMIVDETNREPWDPTGFHFPLDGQDELFPMIMQKMQIQYRRAIEEAQAGNQPRIATPDGFRIPPSRGGRPN